MDDQAAIVRIKQGDLNGLADLVRRYQVKAVYAAYMILHDRSLSEEIVQNAFVRVYEKIHQFEEGRPFAPWFLRIVLNEATKTARSQRRLSSIEEDPDEDARVLARWLVDPQPLPEEQVEMLETSHIVRTALKQLTPEQRATVVMRYYLDMSEAEMAVRLDRPVSTVKWWLRAARKRLGELVNPTETVKPANPAEPSEDRT
jgi:RNA polymerase sigma-70 factor (ECF subfamily)